MTQTFQVDYYDKDLAQRLYWVEAKNESDAENRCRKECHVNKINSISPSLYTIDELIDHV